MYKYKIITFLLTATLIFLITMVCLYVPGKYREYQQARTLQSEFSEKVRNLYVENQHKELFLRHFWEDKEFLQQQAREQLGFVRPKELVYRFEEVQ